MLSCCHGPPPTHLCASLFACTRVGSHFAPATSSCSPKSPFVFLKCPYRTMSVQDASTVSSLFIGFLLPTTEECVFCFSFFFFPNKRIFFSFGGRSSFPLLEDDRDKVLGSCCCSSRMYRNKNKRKEKSRVCGVRKEHGTPDLYRAPAKTKRPGPGKRLFVPCQPVTVCVCVSVCLCVCV